MQVLLLSDGSVTRHLQLMTGSPVVVVSVGVDSSIGLAQNRKEVGMSSHVCASVPVFHKAHYYKGFTVSFSTV